MPWGLWGMGLRLKEQKGPRRAPHPWSQRAGDLTWEPSRLPGLEWEGLTPSSPLLLFPDGSSHLSFLISPASLLCPQDPCGLEGALERGYQPGSSAGSPARVDQAIAFCSSLAPPGGSLPPDFPDLPGLRGTDPVWPPLLLPPQPPQRPTGSLGGSSHLPGRQGPPPATGRHPSCGETLIPCLPTLPS